MSRAEALTKLLALGDLSRPEIETLMGGDQAAVKTAMVDLINAGDITYRHDGSGHRLFTLTPAARVAVFGGAHA